MPRPLSATVFPAPPTGMAPPSVPTAPAALDETLAGALLSIDLDAIAANWRLLAGRARAGAACAAVVKADAYGLGAVPVAGTLFAAGCRTFFVAHVAEGLALRPHLPAEAALYVLHGPPPGAEAACAEAGLVPVLNSLEQIAAWSALASRLGRPLRAAIQVDSGMARCGLSARDLDRLEAEPERLRGIDLRLVMSHLACADEPASLHNARQLATFRTLRHRLPALPASLANSSGVFLGPDYHFDLLRPGAALYGVNPTPERANPMRPVVRLQAKVLQTRAVPAGALVGYGGTFRAGAPSRIATLAVGYADGFLRALGNRACAWKDGVRLPLAGRVSMDLVTLDVSALPEEALPPGALVDLIGPERPVDALAAEAGTIGYEILTSLGRRYHRRYVGGGESSVPAAPVSSNP